MNENRSQDQISLPLQKCSFMKKKKEIESRDFFCANILTLFKIPLSFLVNFSFSRLGPRNGSQCSKACACAKQAQRRA